MRENSVGVELATDAAGVSPAAPPTGVSRAPCCVALAVCGCCCCSAGGESKLMSSEISGSNLASGSETVFRSDDGSGEESCETNSCFCEQGSHGW